MSQLLTGNVELSPDIAARIHDLLASRDADFINKLARLSAALGQAGVSREARLAAIAEDQLQFALEIAKPWYLGYVGSPSTTILHDDAEFATFLDAQAYQKVAAQVPLPSYPGRSGQWWDAVPEGVTAPPMPEDVKRWDFQPPGPRAIRPPAPEALKRVQDHAAAEARGEGGGQGKSYVPAGGTQEGGHNGAV